MKVGVPLHHEPTMMYFAILLLLLSTLIGIGEGYFVKFRSSFESQSQLSRYFKPYERQIIRNAAAAARSSTTTNARRHLASMIRPYNYRSIIGTKIYYETDNVNSSSVKEEEEIERENEDRSTTTTTAAATTITTTTTTTDSSPHPNGEDPVVVGGDKDTTTTEASTTPSNIKKSAVTPMIRDEMEDEETTSSVSEEDVTSIFQDDDMTLSKDELLPSSPPLSFGKFLTMQQEKRVVVTINYSQESGLRPFFLTAAKRIKKSFPDVLIEKNALRNNLGPGGGGGGNDNSNNSNNNPDASSINNTFFEILVDGKTIVKTKSQRNSKKYQQQQLQGEALIREMSVFVSMAEIESAISKARKRRRPVTLYKAAKSGGIADASTRLEMLRVIEQQQQRRRKEDRDI